MQVFYPVHLPETEEEREVYGEDSVAGLCNHYSVVLQRMNCDIAQAEWVALQLHMKRQPKDLNVFEMYNRMFINPDLFQNILMLVEIILSIPVSSAIRERGFSNKARVKSDWRSRLDSEMLNALMAISIEGPDLSDYKLTHSELLSCGGIVDRGQKITLTPTPCSFR